MMKHIPDLQTADHGSIVSLGALTHAGRRFMVNVGDGSPDQYAEPRYAIDIMQGALRAGLTLRDAATGRIARPGAERRVTA